MNDEKEKILESIKWLESENGMLHDDILDAQSNIEKNERSIEKLRKQLNSESKE